jgi:hypothetical protein
MNGRRVAALAAALLVAPLLGACAKSVQGAPLPAEEQVVQTKSKAPRPTSRTGSPTSPRSTSGGGSGTGTVTIGTPKVLADQPDCANVVTAEQVTQATGMPATPKSVTRGFCTYDLKAGSQPTGLALITFSSTIENAGSEPFTFEGNSASRKLTSNTTCDLRIALNDNRSSMYRSLWVTLLVFKPSEPVCDGANKLAKVVWDKLPNG